MLRYIQNDLHYTLLMEEVTKVKHTLWMGTADLKDLYVKQGRSALPFLALLEKKIRQGVSIRLLHAKEPGENFRNDFDKYPALWKGLERALCPRIHFKLLLFDLERIYIGSANLTGAAFGMKSGNKVEAAITQFDEVWMGKPCKTCGRKEVCKDRIIQI